MEKTISEILYADDMSAAAKEALERIGIKLKRDDDGIEFMIISDSHAGIQKILRNTEHEKTWGRILKRFPGAVAKPSERFMGKCHRATLIPTKNIYK